MQLRKFTILLTGIAIGTVGMAVVSQPRSLFSGVARAATADVYRQLNLFGDIFERVRADYVEKPDEAKLIEAAINGMLTSLDPHSSYLDAKSFRDMQVQTRGEFGGLGIEVTMEDGLIKVVTPIDDTPASKAGILSGDLISQINDEQVQGMTLPQAVEKMRGPVDSVVRVKVLRGPKDKREPIEFKITRAVIKIQSVKFRVEDDVGYVRITSFNEQTTALLRKAIEEIKAKIPNDKLKGYVIDLRNNPGGLLDQAISVSDTLLDRGEIVSTRARNPEDTQRWTAKTGDLTNGKPIIVLVNGGSASASEIVAGALQDHKRAAVLGTRSFGKGSVQTIIPLGPNGALRLTTARYYTPSGKSIQAKGIDPDIEVLQEIPEELKKAAESPGEAGLKGHLKIEGQEERPASSAYVPPDPKDDKQLNFAFELLRGTKTNPNFPPNPKQASIPQPVETQKK